MHIYIYINFLDVKKINTKNRDMRNKFNNK